MLLAVSPILIGLVAALGVQLIFIIFTYGYLRRYAHLRRGATHVATALVLFLSSILLAVGGVAIILEAVTFWTPMGIIFLTFAALCLIAAISLLLERSHL